MRGFSIFFNRPRPRRRARPRLLDEDDKGEWRGRCLQRLEASETINGRDALLRDPALHVQEPLICLTRMLMANGALAPSEVQSFIISFDLSNLHSCLNVQRRIAQERVPTERSNSCTVLP
jgi:hypothetical protein